MTFDERMRDGLRGGSSLIQDAATEELIGEVLARGRRRRLVRQTTAIVAILAALGAAVVVTPKMLHAHGGVRRTVPAVPPNRPGTITTVVGTGEATSAGDGGPSISAAIAYPIDLDFDRGGNLYVLEHEDPQVVRKIDTSGAITTVVGPGAPGKAGNVVLGTTTGATGLAIDAAGSVYVAGGVGGMTEFRVIRVDSSGNVATVAGTGSPGTAGDGGPATAARLRNIWDVAVDLDGNLYIAENARIRKVDADGVISTVAGAETSPGTRIGRVTGVAVDPSGSVYFIDYGRDRIFRIEKDGELTAIAGQGEAHGCFGGDGGPAANASFCAPEHLAVDVEGSVYVADTYNHRIRRIGTDGIITTVAGNGEQGFSGDGHDAVDARLSEPASVAVGPDGALYIADSGNHRIRRVLI
jgi:sugar lactone lactonase YvrE